MFYSIYLRSKSTKDVITSRFAHSEDELKKKRLELESERARWEANGTLRDELEIVTRNEDC